MERFVYSMFVVMISSITILSAQGNDNIGQETLQGYVGQNGYGASDFSSVVISDDYTSQGIRHIYYLQALGGMSIYGSTAAVHLKDGQVITSNNRFIPGLSGMQVSSNISITAKEAIKALCDNKGLPLNLANLNIITEDNSEVHRTTKLSPSNIALSEITAKLMYFKADDNTLKVAWSIGIEVKENDGEWMNYFIDADSGALLNELSWTVDHNHDDSVNNHKGHDHNLRENTSKSHIAAVPSGAQYNVYPAPLESPLYGGRSIVVDPANPIASPFGWHDTDGVAGPEHTDTQGNNVDAHDNVFNRPDGGAALNFDFPLDFTQPAATYINASVTNLFYWNNHIHDVMYGYGFDEESGNFQVNNYGNGGLGTDAVFATSQIGPRCNATFGTPPDGSRPSMNMFVCYTGGNTFDGSFDNLVVVHEYAHGISNRLTGGPALSGCLRNDEQMGEGWSDWYGLMLTMETGDMGTDARGIGTFLFGEMADGDGIRAYPYSTDLTVDPRTYDDIKTTGTSPHRLGSIWAAILWEVTWALTDVYGFDADLINGSGGNNIAIQLVTEGLKSQPCSPGFIDGRDAILAADMALYGGANQCLLWNAFAKRGLGFSADQGLSTSRTDGTEAFDLPDDVPNMCPDPRLIIPTMSQWMLFILGLIMMSLSVVYIVKKARIHA